MSKRLQDNSYLLHLICHCSAKQRVALLETLSNDQLLAICECVYNVLNGTVPLDKNQFEKIRQKKDFFRIVKDKKTSQIRKRRALVQTGGALPALLVPALTLASTIIGGLIK